MSTGELDVMSTDWSKWHEAYDAADAGLPDRLVAVRDHVERHLNATAPGPVRVVSACAGDGRDLLGVLERRTDADRVSALLVEYDRELAARARKAAEGFPRRSRSCRRTPRGAMSTPGRCRRT